MRILLILVIGVLWAVYNIRNRIELNWQNLILQFVISYSLVHLGILIQGICG